MITHDVCHSWTVWAWTAPVDLRKGYRALCSLVEAQLRRDPLSGELFLFVNRPRTMCKVFYWDGTGLCVFLKRLERGRFAPIWRRLGEAQVEMTRTELMLFLEGCQEVGYRSFSPPSRIRKSA